MNTILFSDIVDHEVYRTDPWSASNLDVFGMPMARRWECSQSQFAYFILGKGGIVYE